MLLTNSQKHDKLIELGKKFGLDTIVESGTYEGDGCIRFAEHFKKVWSIELSHELAEESKKRCAHLPNVEIIEGDASVVMKQIVDKLEGPAIFFIDSHYSGGRTVKGPNGEITSIMAELQAIYSVNRALGHVIICDDVRDFTIRHSGFDFVELLNTIRLNFRAHEWFIADDLLTIYPIAPEFPE